MAIDKTILIERKKQADEIERQIQSLRRDLDRLGDIEITSGVISFRLTHTGDLFYYNDPINGWQVIPPGQVERVVDTLAPLFGYAKVPKPATGTHSATV